MRPAPPQGRPAGKRPASSSSGREPVPQQRKAVSRSPLHNRLPREAADQLVKPRQPAEGPRQPAEGPPAPPSTTPAGIAPRRRFRGRCAGGGYDAEAEDSGADDRDDDDEEDDVRRQSAALGKIDGALLALIWSAREVRRWTQKEIADMCAGLAAAGILTCPQLAGALEHPDALNERLRAAGARMWSMRSVAALQSCLSDATRIGRSMHAASVSQQQPGADAMLRRGGGGRGQMRRAPPSLRRRRRESRTEQPRAHPISELLEAEDNSDDSKSTGSGHATLRASTPPVQALAMSTFSDDEQRRGGLAPAVLSVSLSRRCSSAGELLQPEPAGHGSASTTPKGLTRANSGSSRCTASPVHFPPQPSPRPTSDALDASMQSFRWTSLAQPHGTAADYRIVEIPLHHLYFYQSAIAGHFSDGRSLQQTVDGLRSGSLSPWQMPLAHAMLAGKRLYCMGTRRLTCFNFAWGRTEPDRKIPVLWNGSNNVDALPQGDDVNMQVLGGLRLDGRIVTTVERLPASEDVDVKSLRKAWMTAPAPVKRKVGFDGHVEEYFAPEFDPGSPA
eukprot:TRINITY_DN5798_c0_g1_i1.p1 TRINITY_DN5798_c0_g1~~TRINITY_DN5798_c0_g1_i1.p1  ORF type:complete len:561 (+),score=170.44 TRINITY_DN5798_c0_g1_i1:48-1730(+)